MPVAAPDIDTLRLCSILASTAFAFVFLVRWRRSGEAFWAYWGCGSALYAGSLVGLAVVTHPIVMTLLVGGIAVSVTLVLSGVLSFEGRRPFLPWMVLPILAACLGQAVPDLVWPPAEAARMAGIGSTVGLSANMLICGGLLAWEDVPSPSFGRRIAGWATLAYVPFELVAIGLDLHGGYGTSWTTMLPHLSDQLFLAVLSFGLLAMPEERAQAALREVALRDPLTGAQNRAGLARAAVRARPGSSGIVLMDVDHFKAINDRHGHAAGDAILVTLAAAAGHLLPGPDDVLARLGGDEFAAILHDTDDAGLRIVADQLRIAARLCPGASRWTVSVGIGMMEPGEADLSGATERADRALYRAKSDGRDRVAA